MVFLVDSHMGENLETDFQPNFHPKWEQLILNVTTKLKIGLRTTSPNENCPTLVFTQQKKIQKQHKKKGLLVWNLIFKKIEFLVAQGKKVQKIWFKNF
jgi:hypothetical protein